MEDYKKSDSEQEGHNPQQHKKYPGYVPQERSENSSDENTDPAYNTDSDSRLAEKGPVRNPNYHQAADVVKHDNKEPIIKKGNDGKTLQDFNNTDPKRDINKEIVKE